MPDREVQTIEHLIFYQYAKLIARSAFGMPSGKEAKSEHYGFIKQTFRDLRDGRKSWSDITREDRQLAESEKQCAYCGSSADLHWEHIVPKSLRILDKCASCDRIQTIHNLVRACRRCNLAKGTMGLYQFFKVRYPEDRKFYDRIPPLLEKKYLKIMYECHRCAGTLNSADLDGDGEITVLDIDEILKK